MGVMLTLKKKINSYVQKITWFLVSLMLVIIVYIQLITEQQRAYDNALETFSQIEQVLSQNPHELSFIFSLFRVNPEANFFAIDSRNQKIVGSSEPAFVDKAVSDIGLSYAKVANDTDGFHATVNGQLSFCLFHRTGDNYIGQTIPIMELYQRIPLTVIVLAICLISIAFILKNAVTRYMNKYVVDEISEVNRQLQLISEGNLQQIIDIQSSLEFSQLSEYINRMVDSLIKNNKKMSYVLSKTDMYIGVYEYSTQTKHVRFTEYIPRIFSLDEPQVAMLSADLDKFREYLDSIRRNPFDNDPGVYKLPTQQEKYVRLEELNNDIEVFGVAIDVTAEVIKRKHMDAERLTDSLTSLYNRRGLEAKLSLLFQEPEQLGYSAMIMIDADGLKTINDTYGHARGDIYLQKIAGILKNFGLRSSLAARYGGDEFVLFLYDYDDMDELINTIRTLEYIQNNSSARLEHNLTVPLQFSFGYCVTDCDTDYQSRLKEADRKMYINKKARKSGLNKETNNEE